MWLQLNNFDNEVIVGATPNDPLELDDTLPWVESKPSIIVVVQIGNCLADLLRVFIDPDIMKCTKMCTSKENFPMGNWKKVKALVFSTIASQNSGENFTVNTH